jgi:hypothetical protein
MIDAWWTKDALWPLPLLLPLCLAGPLVPLLMRYAKRGQHRSGVLFTWVAVTVLYGFVGSVGVLARLIGQPEYVWVTLLYPGVCTAMAYALTFPLVRKTYARVELRKIAARDIQ